jgi:hypothetical protein
MRVPAGLRCLLAVTLLAAAAVGQSNYAGVTGTVRDVQSLPVAKATVQFKALSTGAVRVVTTNDKGLFYAPALTPDDYELVTQAPGFAPVTQSLRLEVGQKLAIEISLKVGPIKEGVQVTALADVLRTADASVGEVIEPKSIQELPLNGRMLVDLVLTVPGAHVGFGAQTGETNPLYWRPGQRSAIVIGGSRPNANFFLLDGATNTDPTFNPEPERPRLGDGVKSKPAATPPIRAALAAGRSTSSRARARTSTTERCTNSCARADASTSGRWAHLVQNNFGASFGGLLLKRWKRPSSF